MPYDTGYVLMPKCPPAPCGGENKLFARESEYLVVLFSAALFRPRGFATTGDRYYGRNELV